jgi:hypothetical protein
MFDSFFPSYGFRACSLFRSHSFPLSLSGPRFRFSNFVCVCIIFWVMFRCSVCRFGVVSSPVHILYLRNTLLQQRKQNQSSIHTYIPTDYARFSLCRKRCSISFGFLFPIDGTSSSSSLFLFALLYICFVLMLILPLSAPLFFPPDHKELHNEK